jgi:hypothetical protein
MPLSLTRHLRIYPAYDTQTTKKEFIRNLSKQRYGISTHNGWIKSGRTFWDIPAYSFIGVIELNLEWDFGAEQDPGYHRIQERPGLV